MMVYGLVWGGIDIGCIFKHAVLPCVEATNSHLEETG